MFSVQFDFSCKLKLLGSVQDWALGTQHTLTGGSGKL